MAGLAILYTPIGTGRLLVIVTGSGANSTAGDGVSCQVRQGTGTAPVNGAALAGTAFGIAKSMTSATAAALDAFCLVAVIGSIAAPLAGGVQVWIDLSEAAITGGTASLSNLDVTILEI